MSLLMLMPRFKILHFPGPEMARLLKKGFETVQKIKFEKIDHNSGMESIFGVE